MCYTPTVPLLTKRATGNKPGGQGRPAATPRRSQTSYAGHAPLYGTS